VVKIQNSVQPIYCRGRSDPVDARETARRRPASDVGSGWRTSVVYEGNVSFG